MWTPCLLSSARSRQCVFSAMRGAALAGSVRARLARTHVLISAASRHTLPLARAVEERPRPRLARLADVRPDEGVPVRVRPEALAVCAHLPLHDDVIFHAVLG